MEEVLQNKLAWNIESIRFVLPELILSAVAILVLVAGLLYRRRPMAVYFGIATMVGCILSILVIIGSWGLSAKPVSLFQGLIRTDRFDLALKLVIDSAGFLTALYSIFHRELRSASRKSSEFAFLLCTAMVGAHLLVMSTNLLLLFLSIELLSLSSYVLVGVLPTSQASEGSLKYFLYGTVASAVMLYGFSLLFGLTGTLDFSSSVFFEQLLRSQTPLFLVAGILSLTGLLFKITAFPLHVWAPDVYEAAPAPVTAFLSVVPKVAGLGALARFVLGLNVFGQGLYNWQTILAVISLATIFVGNLSALWQSAPKRLMAFSSIAQSGFMLIGLVAFSLQGIQFFLFYAFVYLVMNYLVFLYIQHFERRGMETITDYAGKGTTFPFAFASMTAGLISLTGIPPMAGFLAKLFIFTGLWDAFQGSGSIILAVLLVMGLLNTVIAIFYYLKIPYFAFFKGHGATPERTVSTNVDRAENLIGLVLVLLLLGLFIAPSLLMGWLNSINFVL